MEPSLNPRFLSNLSPWRPLLLVLLAALAVPVLDCGRAHKAGTHPGAASAIRVISSNNSLVLTTSAAEFQFFSNGYLQASLLRNGARLTLDDSKPGTDSEYVESGGKQIRDFQFGLSRAAIGETSVGSGKRGKRIEIAGRSASL